MMTMGLLSMPLLDQDEIFNNCCEEIAIGEAAATSLEDEIDFGKTKGAR